MNHSPSPDHATPKALRPPPGPMLHAAKWPPDDDALPPGGPSSLGGYGGGDDGNFKKGRFSVVAIVIGVVLAGAAAAIFVIGGTKQAEELSPKQVAEEKKNVAVLPVAEALPRWREWAAGDEPKLREEGFAQLAWIKDPEGLALIAKGLESPDHRIRGTAATAILEYGSPAADSVKPALLKALQDADASDKPQIAWALATLHEPAAFDEVMKEYRAGHLAKVQRLDGNPAFDPEHIAAMVPIDQLAGLASDESESVRQLVATVLSRNADARFTEPLIKLVKDPSIDVAREAAVGLGKIANEQAMQPLLDALSKADKDSRQRFLEALRDGVGGKGLVLALRSVDKSTRNAEKFQTKQIFEMLQALEDPRSGDSLAEYIASNPAPRWRTEAAIRLAAVGDLRALPTLAWRMKQDPLNLYNKDLDPEYRMDDNERVVSARMLADLAILYPDKREEIRREAYDGVYYWATSKPQPHANALRFFAASDARDALPKLRAWSTPKTPFPKEGQQEFPAEWGTAQSALRYLGWMQDPQAWRVLETQLRRRPEKLDATMDSLLQGGLGVLGMTLRAVGVGASHGFAQWGDAKAFPLLVKFIDDKQNNEQARIEACFSLGWVANDSQIREVVEKVKANDKPDPKTQLIRACYLETLSRKPVPEATAGLVDLIDGHQEVEVQRQAARAVGFGGFSPVIGAQLVEKLKNPATRSDASLAILMGGDADAVRRMITSYEELPAAELDLLKEVYDRSFGYWSDYNYENGDVARWIDNAHTATRVRVRDSLQDWPKLILARALRGIDYDNGPHSITRVQFRVRLLRDARGADEKKRAQAVRILKFMGEQGALMALKSETGTPSAEPARQALFELMNPKVATDALPDRPTGGGGNVAP